MSREERENIKLNPKLRTIYSYIGDFRTMTAGHLDPWEADLERKYEMHPWAPPKPAQDRALTGLDMGFVTDNVEPCPRCGSCIFRWSRQTMTPECDKCGLVATAVTGYRIVWRQTA